MNRPEWHTLSPLDGRYSSKIEGFSKYFSEFSIMQYRVSVEISYFIELVELGIKELSGFPKDKYEDLRNLYLKFDEESMEAIKKHEVKTSHDVKAVEYFIADKFKDLGLEKYRSFIHFGLTSQDINSIVQSFLLMISHFNKLMPSVLALSSAMTSLADESDALMLARTHGQPATITNLKKELYVFIIRHQNTTAPLLNKDYFSAKFGGNVGNFSMHQLAYPNTNWIDFRIKFVKRFGISLNLSTTQIEPYDNLARYCHEWIGVATILLDYVQDMWSYISMDYFKIKVKKGVVGSSTMPHKVNPIHFENAEGNLHMARSLLSMFAQKLPISRLQRDLSDSTVIRNMGVALGHILLAINGITKGTQELSINKKALESDLKKYKFLILLEAYQTLLRKAGKNDAYECVRDFSRGKELTEASLDTFIRSLDVSEEVKDSLMSIGMSETDISFKPFLEACSEESSQFQKQMYNRMEEMMNSVRNTL